MTTRSLLAAVAMTCVGMTPILAQQEPTRPAPTPPSTPGQPSMDQMQEMWEKSGQPGEQHRLLAPLVGEWTTEAKFMMGAETTESRGTAVNTWEFDRRFVKQEYQGEFMDKPFRGIGWTGFDNNKKEYVSTWMDSMSTGIMYSEGKYDASTKTFTFAAEVAEPTGQTGKHKHTLKIVDDNTHVLNMFMVGPDGKEMKMGEITYHRKGAGAPRTAPSTPATPETRPGR